jgi:hypothetical protein
MAKMIYVVRTGKSDASAYNNDTTTFTDINSHWARGYIKYCQALGIIAGKSTTIFDPDATVTTQEAAKMLLVTLGYDAEKAGLVGTGWGNRTTALADENTLLKDVDSGATAGAPRQYAAQLIYNTIFAPTVVLRDGEYTNQAYASAQGNITYNPTVGEKYMDLVKHDAGILLTVDKVDGKDYFNITTTTESFTKVQSDVSELIGQKVEVLEKDTKDAGKYTIYGVYADEDSKVLATGYLSQLKTVSGNNEKIKLNGTEYKLDSINTSVSVYTVNSDTVAAKNLVQLAAVGGEANSILANDAVSEIKLIDNDGNGKVDFAVYYPVTVGKVSSVSSSSFTVKYQKSGSKSIDFDDADVYTGIAKDDYVTILEDDYRPYSTHKVEKIDSTTGKVTATRTGEARVDGGDWLKIADSVDTLNVGSTYDLVVYGGTILYQDETAGDSSTVAFVTATGSPDHLTGSDDYTLKVRMYFQDGTDDEVKVEKYDGDKLTSSKASELKTSLVNSLVTYSKLSNGNYDVKLVNSSNKVGTDTFETPTATNIYSKQKLNGYAPADDAVIFVHATTTVNGETKGETKVITGKQLKNWADSLSYNVSSTGMLLKKTSGINYVKFAALVLDNAKVPSASNDTRYGYLTSDAYTGTANDEKNKAIYEVWTGSENAVLAADSSSVKSGAKAGAIISYTVDGKWIDDVTVLPTTGSAIEKDKNNVTLKAAYEVAITGIATDDKSIAYVTTGNVSAQYDFDDDCVFIAINDKDTEGMEGSKASLLEAAETTSADGNTVYYKTNAYVVIERDSATDDFEIVAVIFDTKNTDLKNYSLIKK